MSGANFSYPSEKDIYTLGYPDGTGSCGGNCDTSVKTTLLRHYNWDSVTNGTKICSDSGEPGCQGGSSDTVLPSSLYLSSKPSWYGSCTWPPINPSGPTVSDIPAKVRYEGGSCGGGGSDATKGNGVGHKGGFGGGFQ
jgi:hypothetical protein